MGCQWSGCPVSNLNNSRTKQVLAQHKLFHYGGAAPQRMVDCEKYRLMATENNDIDFDLSRQ
jgi:hypothetical protein